MEVVREIEGEFAQELDEDPRFSNLREALALYGADGYCSEAEFVKELLVAVKTLQGICAYRDCNSTCLEGTRFCAEHMQPALNEEH